MAINRQLSLDTLIRNMMANGITAFLLVSLISCSAISVDAQEPQLVEVFQESDAIPSAEEASGRSFGMFQNFDALTYKENLLHNKISFLFSLVPRPNVPQWNRPPYPGGMGHYPIQQGGFPPGYPAHPAGPYRPPPFGNGGGMIPNQGFYPGAGFNNPYYPSIVPGGGYPPFQPGLYPPGVLPVVSENNIPDASGGNAGGNKPPPSASVAAAAPPAAAPATTTAAPAAEESVAEAAEEEETKRHKIIKMMPKSFRMN